MSIQPKKPSFVRSLFVAIACVIGIVAIIIIASAVAVQLSPYVNVVIGVLLGTLSAAGFAYADRLFLTQKVLRNRLLCGATAALFAALTFLLNGGIHLM